jgi:hypothetical protein
MATIPPYVARGTHVGQKVAVKTKKVVWLTIGQGKVEAFSDFEVDIAGKIRVPGYNGDLTFHLQLLDQDATALGGPCRLQLNELVDEKAKYRATHEKLTVFAVLGGAKQNVSILPTKDGKQTECQLFGHINQTVHLEPH